MTQEFIHVATPEENSSIEAYHSMVEREVLQPRQFEDIQTAVETFSRWEVFYNNRRLQRSLCNIAPKQQGDQWLVKMNKEPLPINYTEALSKKLANVNHLKIEVKPVLVYKIFSEPKPLSLNKISIKTVTLFLKFVRRTGGDTQLAALFTG